MNKEDLLKLKKKILELSEEDKKERDKYLRDIAMDKILGPQIGYPEIDKPWLQYYDLDNYKDSIKMTVYESLVYYNHNYLNDIAIEYFGAKISYRKLFNTINSLAKSFKYNGVKKGDFVTICCPGIPETVYSFYALSKLGAVANMIAPYFDKKEFVDRIYDCKSNLLIVMDSFYDDIKDAVNKSNIEKVVIVPTLNSSPLGLVSKKIKTKQNNEILWNNFLKEGKYLSNVETIPYEKDLPLAMVYSSGTTGASKGILLTNDSFQNSISDYFNTGLDIHRNQKFYQIIPTWYSTGISTSVHLPLVCGATVFMDPRFERDIFIKNVLKAKPNYAVAPTSMYEGFINNPRLKKQDLSYFINAFEGGEPLSKELATRINEVFVKHNNNSSIKVGYGQCECGATITTQNNLTEHCNGSVGVPLPGINIQICDDDMNSLVYGERGQIVVDTNSSMIGYFKNEEESKKYFYVDQNGHKWNCTGDIGYIDRKGNLFVEGRASDYSIINGEKFYNFDIENIIKNVDGVKLCDVLHRDLNGKQELVVHLILEEKDGKLNYDELFKNIQNRIYQETHNLNMVPYIYKVRKEFPYAKSGKRDTGKMMSETDGFVELKFDEKEIKRLVRK